MLHRLPPQVFCGRLEANSIHEDRDEQRRDLPEALSCPELSFVRAFSIPVSRDSGWLGNELSWFWADGVWTRCGLAWPWIEPLNHPNQDSLHPWRRSWPKSSHPLSFSFVLVVFWGWDRYCCRRGNLRWVDPWDIRPEETKAPHWVQNGGVGSLGVGKGMDGRDHRRNGAETREPQNAFDSRGRPRTCQRDHPSEGEHRTLCIGNNPRGRDNSGPSWLDRSSEFPGGSGNIGGCHKFWNSGNMSGKCYWNYPCITTAPYTESLPRKY